MRLWHYKLIDYVPGQYMLSEWREVLAMSGYIKIHGKLNHATVNRANDFDIEHLKVYADLVIKNFAKRDYRIGTNALQKLVDDIGFDPDNTNYEILENGDVKLENGELLFDGFHNERYLKQNLLMFQEKYDCGMLDEEEWSKIQNKFKDLVEF